MESVFDSTGFYKLDLSLYDEFDEQTYEEATETTLSIVLDELEKEGTHLNKSVSPQLRRVETAANHFIECAIKYGEWRKSFNDSEQKLNKRTKIVFAVVLPILIIDYVLALNINQDYVGTFVIVVALLNFGHFYNSFFGSEITDRRYSFLNSAHVQLEILLGKYIGNDLLNDLVVGELTKSPLLNASINVLMAQASFSLLSESGKKNVNQKIKTSTSFLFDEGYSINSSLDRFPAKAVGEKSLQSENRKRSSWKSNINWGNVFYAALLLSGWALLVAYT